MRGRGLDSSDLRKGEEAGCCECGNEHLGSINGGSTLTSGGICPCFMETFSGYVVACSFIQSSAV